MSVELKIKAKSLAAEAQMIRKEEIHTKKQARWNREHQGHEAAQKFEKIRQDLYDHRIDVVRWESRATHLARGFIKGLAYKDIERDARLDAYTKGKLVGRVHKLLTKYHDKTITADAVMAWFDQ